MRRLSMPLLLIVLLSVPLVVCAQVYKWKDAHGTVHFSDTPPPHGVTYTIVKTSASMHIESGASANSSKMNAAEENADDSAQAVKQRMADTPANRKSVCDNLQANIKLLNGDSPLITKDAKGKSLVMSKESRGKELAKEQKQYQQFCQ